MTESLLDRVMPSYVFREVHAAEIRAEPTAVFEALQALRGEEVPVARLLFALRSIPGRLKGWQVLTVNGGRPLLEQMVAQGFVPLGERPGSELVLGAIGAFWRLRPGAFQKVSGVDAFRAFETRGVAKAAMNLRITPLEPTGTCRLTTETRIAVFDEATRRRFRLYWLLIRPGSGLIRRGWLRAIKRRAERPC